MVKFYAKRIYHIYWKGFEYVAGKYSAELFYRKISQYSQWNMCGGMFLVGLWYMTWKPKKGTLPSGVGTGGVL